MNNDKKAPSSDDLVHQMERIRARRTRRMSKFVEQTERLGDWREHVRAIPLTSFFLSIVGGAVLAKILLNRPRSSSPNSFPFNSSDHQASLNTGADYATLPPSMRAPSMGRKILRQAGTLLFPMVLAVVRRQIVQAISHRDTFPPYHPGAQREHKQSS